MHLHQPDWKSGVGTVDGGVDPGHHAHRAHAPYRRGAWKHTIIQLRDALKKIRKQFYYFLLFFRQI